MSCLFFFATALQITAAAGMHFSWNLSDLDYFQAYHLALRFMFRNIITEFYAID